MITRRQKIRQFEQLETRFALAGNVTASVDGGGNLLIKGDSLANGITFTETSTGQFDLTGRTAGGAATSVNGQANGTIHLSGVTGSVTIRTLDGDDNIQVPYFNFGGWMIINAGDGKDTITIGNENTASYLVGILSIRTGTGADVIRELNTNVIGNQDLGATQSDGTVSEGNGQNFQIEDSTFGSFLYFNFGGRRAGLVLTDVVTAGDVFVINKVEETLSGFGQTSIKPVVANKLFYFMAARSSIAGNFTFDSTVSSQFNFIDTSTVGGAAQITSVGASNTYYFQNVTFGSLEMSSRRTYTIPDGNFFLPTTTYTVESVYDDVQMQLISVGDELNLQCNGGMYLFNVSAPNAVLASSDNSHASIHVSVCSFGNLSLSLGSVPFPNYAPTTSTESSATDHTTAVVDASQVQGTLSINSRTRLRSDIERQGESLRSTSYINAASASYAITGSSVGNLEFLKDDETAPFVNRSENVGDTSITMTNSVLAFVQFDLPKSNDTVVFNTSSVTNSTAINGGAGTNYFYNNGSALTNLQKSNFAN